METLVSKCALEWWRASGDRSKERLLSLVSHFADINNESANAAYHGSIALAAVREWEWK